MSTIDYHAKLVSDAKDRNSRLLTVTMRFDHGDHAGALTITGTRVEVLRAVALMSGLPSEDAVAIRPCTVGDDKLLVVDASQADSYPAFLAEVVRPGKTDNLR